MAGAEMMTFFDAESFLEQHMDQRREAVGGAGGVGNDVVFGRVVFVVVHTHDDGDVLVFAGGGNDDFFGAGGDVAVATFGVVFGGVGEQAGGFDHNVHAHGFPRQFRRGLGADHLDVPAIDHQHIVVGLVGGVFVG